MATAVNNDDVIRRILKMTRTIAVVGLSPNVFRPSHGVARYLQAAGYRIIPVNPNIVEALGEQAYPDLSSVPESVDLVDVFRRPEFVPEIAEDAIVIGAKSLWLQDGVVEPASAARARAAGLDVVMDDCLMRRHRQFAGELTA
jgi:predicted CoA-binding protein